MTNASIINTTLQSLTRNWIYYSNFYPCIAFSNGNCILEMYANEDCPSFFSLKETWITISLYPSWLFSCPLSIQNEKCMLTELKRIKCHIINSLSLCHSHLLSHNTLLLLHTPAKSCYPYIYTKQISSVYFI